MCGEGMENLVTTSKIQRKEDRGRQTETILDGMCICLGVKDSKDQFKDVRDSTKWRNKIASLIRQEPGR
jgi:hypothetical protein